MADTTAKNALNVPATLGTSGDLVLTGGAPGTILASKGCFGDTALKVETTSGGIRVVFQ